MKTIDEVIKAKTTGLYYGNRLIIPFQAHFLKVVIENEIITDFSSGSKGIIVNEEDDFTNLYFLDYKDLKNSLTKYESIKFVVVEKGKDIFNLKNHKKIAVYLEEKHKARIEETDADILFIE
ncbi:MAG: hypothetical protein A2057_12840 [Ignavibacteria bacterium GWA2_35_9]|nr:MAG: hypothetical protein A2057_12840 [Ignavibacteria bacterium GWA2_35_9]OGU45665.1 MAG: hypothetical protein A2000_02375 [Ignavibacteria bacterium GWB2_36_8]OGU52794.1 MAG: hypothetical protein A2080_08490 [Ignavibacteria bacterium GWC2_36_12]